MDFGSPQFWVALLQIIGVNIVLSGDNAVVIALAARGLPERQRKQAVLIGSAAAVVMRIVLTIVAVELLRLPYLKLIGAALLLYIGIQLLVPEHEEPGKEKSASAGMVVAVRTILIADLVMSRRPRTNPRRRRKCPSGGPAVLFVVDDAANAARSGDARLRVLVKPVAAGLEPHATRIRARRS